MMTHNLAGKIQMLAQPSATLSLEKRLTVFTFERPDTLRHGMIQRGGRLIRPQGELTLPMSANQAVRSDLMQFFDVLKMAA
jgi:hypothetical protein